MRHLMALLLASFLLSGCFGGGGGGSDSDPEPDPSDDGIDLPGGNTTAPPAEPNATVSLTADVSLENNAFTPGEVTVGVGGTVTWTHNDGTEPHNVEGDGIDDSHPNCTNPTAILPISDCMRDGDTYEWTFDTPGTYSYECEIHAGMTGTVLVVDPAAPA
jgi:plastocyanin